MTPNKQWSSNASKVRVLVLALSVVAGLSLAGGALAQTETESQLKETTDPKLRERLQETGPPKHVGEVRIETAFHENGTDFRVTSDKDLSNIIIETCASTEQQKLEFGDGNATYAHTGTERVAGIWVKSGSYQDPNGPAGAGWRFDNPYAGCEELVLDRTTA